jgi:hypothetical protein
MSKSIAKSRIFDIYKVSSIGEVLNVKTKRLVKPYVHKSRNIFYLRICLRNRKFMLHVLVWTAFNGPVPESMQIDHIDNNTFNCNLRNLRLTTREENIANRRKKRFL